MSYSKLLASLESDYSIVRDDGDGAEIPPPPVEEEKDEEEKKPTVLPEDGDDVPDNF